MLTVINMDYVRPVVTTCMHVACGMWHPLRVVRRLPLPERRREWEKRAGECGGVPSLFFPGKGGSFDLEDGSSVLLRTRCLENGHLRGSRWIR